MFDLNNNDISTFLMLIILGLLIWYMTKPKKESSEDAEYFTNNETPVPTMQNYMMNETPLPVEPVLSVAPVLAAAPVLIAPPIQTQVPTLPAPPSETQTPSLSSPTKQETVNMDVNNFQAFDGSYSNDNGADIISAFQAPVQTSNTVISAVDINKKNVQNYDAKDFLPKEINDQWFNTDFSQAKTNITDDKLINTERYVIGINTVGQSLKNASYDIRGTIANPKFSVSPWNNSTYEPDYNIKPLC